MCILPLGSDHLAFKTNARGGLLKNHPLFNDICCMDFVKSYEHKYNISYTHWNGDINLKEFWSLAVPEQVVQKSTFPFERVLYTITNSFTLYSLVLFSTNSWWSLLIETVSALLGICVGNSPVTGEFPAQRPVARSFDVFFDLCLNQRLNNQTRGWWFETPSRPLWRHRNVLIQWLYPMHILPPLNSGYM